MIAAKTRDLFMMIFLVGVKKQFPEIVGFRFKKT